MNPPNNKDCARCGESKPPGDFPKDRRRPDGLFPWCRSCKASDQRQRNRSDDPDLAARIAAKEAERAAFAEAAKNAECECGCGENPGTYVASENGHKRGQPRRFVKGHEARGRVLSAETRAKITGRPVSSTKPGSIHQWLVKHHQKAGRCEECGRRGKTDYAFQRHPEPYTRDRADYRELCRSCHFRLDEPLIGRGPQLAQSTTTEQRRAGGRRSAEVRWGS